MARIGNGGGGRLLTKAPHDKYITPAWILSVLVFITLPFVCSATTGASGQPLRGAFITPPEAGSFLHRRKPWGLGKNE